jgi:hypothetical protein
MRLTTVGLAALLAGCESTDDVIAAQRPGVEKTFAALSALAGKLEPLTATTLKAPPGVALEGAGANAMFIYAEDLAAPATAPKDVPLRTVDSLPLLHCAAILGKKQLFNDTTTRLSPSIAKGTLEACAQLKYALVIVTRRYQRPELQLETKRFAPGKYEADVFLFELASGASLGGFRVAATNDSRVSLLDGDQNHVNRIIANLEGSTYDALRAEAKRAIPGVLP